MSEIRDNFLRATYALSKRGGSEWFEFVICFDALLKYEFERGLKTPPSEATVVLGMNRRMVELRDLFQDIEQIASKLEKAQQQAQAQRSNMGRV